MKLRKLDENNDMTFGHSMADFFQDQIELIAQNVKSRLLLWKGEWYLDTSEGTPWSEDVLGFSSKEIYDMAIRQRILDTDGVTDIENYNSVVDSKRKLTINCTINTIYGSKDLAIAK